MKSKIFIIAVLLVGFLSRILYLNQLPSSLNWDEVSHGYNAYSILKTGKDEWGISFPLIFRCFGDFKLPVYIYLSIPSIFLFGLNQFSIRLLSVLAGSIVPLIIFLILKKIIKSKSIIPYFGLLIATLSPGLIFLSRIALEANLFMLFFLVSIYFLISQKYAWSTIFYGIGLFTYNSSRVLLPFYLITLIYLAVRNKLDLKKSFLKFIPFLILVAIAVFQTLNTSGQARYQWVSLLDSGSINKINELRQIYPRFLVNKVSYFTITAAKNYISHFNPNFLFFNGGSHYQFSLQGFYLISPLLIPFLILGVVYLLRNIKQPVYQIIFFLWLVSPIPSSITRDAPHILRSIIFIPFSIIIISLGLNFFTQKYTKLSIIYVLFALLIGQISFWPKYIKYCQTYSSSWQYGYKQAIDFIKTKYDEYPQIIFTKKYGEAHEFILFYWPWNPSLYHSDSNLNWDYHASWYWVNSFDRFTFLNDWEIKEKTQKVTDKTLLITSPNNYNQEGSNLIKTIYFLDGQPVFDILELNENQK